MSGRWGQPETESSWRCQGRLGEEEGRQASYVEQGCAFAHTGWAGLAGQGRSG